MSKQEKIVCAAVKTKEHGTKINLYVEYPEHIKKDKQIYGVFGECSHEKGFITNKNRFVTPQEALQLTGRQNEMRFQNRKYLLPEDLY